MLIKWRIHIKNQRGAFSPFMFGILAGLSIFSTALKKQAELELAALEERQAKQAREELEAITEAVENRLMRESGGGYVGGAITMADIQADMSKGSGFTRGAQNIVIRSQSATGNAQDQRVFITTSDDAYIRSDVAAATAAQMQTSDLNERSDVAMIDVQKIRRKQMKNSIEALNSQLNLIFAYWRSPDTPEGGYALPTAVNYAATVQQPQLTDFWGNTFTYNRLTAQTGTLSFTTPWTQTVTVDIDMN